MVLHGFLGLPFGTQDIVVRVVSALINLKGSIAILMSEFVCDVMAKFQELTGLFGVNCYLHPV